MHHAEAQAARGGGAAAAERLAADADDTRVRRDEARGDEHERRFAGAVFADERVHGTCFDAQVDRVAGHHTRVTLGDALKLERRGAHWRGTWIQSCAIESPSAATCASTGAGIKSLLCSSRTMRTPSSFRPSSRIPP